MRQVEQAVAVGNNGQYERKLDVIPRGRLTILERKHKRPRTIEEYCELLDQLKREIDGDDDDLTNNRS